LQYSWLRTLQGRHADFWQVTQDALEFALESLELTETGLRERLMQLYLALDSFPEVPAVLRRLRGGGLAMAILSNGTPAMLAAAVASAGRRSTILRPGSSRTIGPSACRSRRPRWMRSSRGSAISSTRCSGAADDLSGASP
jgi:hypothetical protein